jgi:SAM-dependent methyltransferase
MKAPAYFAHPLATVAPRDLLLLQLLNPSRTDTALEIGTGSGSSLFRLSGSVGALHSLDISPGAIARICQFVRRRRTELENAQLFVADFCDPEAPARLPGRYDLIFSCDTLEHVAQPAAFFANLYRALKPAGRIFIAFPNEHPSIAHGITFFERQETLRELLERAGFAPDQIQVNAFRLTPTAERFLDLGWRLPRRLTKRFLRWVKGKIPAGENPCPPRDCGLQTPANPSEPQTFGETDFFRWANRLEPLAPLINAYCWVVLVLMSLAAPVYEVLPAPEVLWNADILIRASRKAPRGGESRPPDG